MNLSLAGVELKPDGYHVYPGDNIQDALQLAAKDPANKVVKVHAGIYRPQAKLQALVWFNRNHDGIHLEAVGEVTLTAANPDIASPKAQGYPAMVNHVVYFGDGISSNTVFQGFRITGANHSVTQEGTQFMEPDNTLEKELFFYNDGGGIKIFGRSYPTILNVEVAGNYSNPCGGGVSVDHNGDWKKRMTEFATFQNCIFRNNRTQVTGAGVDVLPDSSAHLVNCLFIGNMGNLGPDYVSAGNGGIPFTNSAALTVFEGSRAIVERCTFVNNRNGVDDLARASVYSNCIFWNNNLEGGLPGGVRYALTIKDRAEVKGCHFNGRVIDPNHCVASEANQLNAPAPDFDADWAPRAKGYENIGYRRVPSAASN